jgi:hypothetical protein
MNEIIIAQGIEQEAARFIIRRLVKDTGALLIKQYESSFVFLGTNDKEQLIYYSESDKAIKQRELD